MISDPNPFVSVSPSEDSPPMAHSPAIASYLDNFVVLPCGGVVGDSTAPDAASAKPSATATAIASQAEVLTSAPSSSKACDRALDRLLRFSAILLFGAATLYLLVIIQQITQRPFLPQPSPSQTQPHSPMM